MKTLLILLPLTFLITSCATMKNGPQQTVRIETPDVQGAVCELSNRRGHWHLGATPATIRIDRAASSLVIECHQGRAIGKVSIASKFQKHAILGGISGMSLDVATGSGYEYPTTIKVPMKSVQ